MGFDNTKQVFDSLTWLWAYLDGLYYYSNRGRITNTYKDLMKFILICSQNNMCSISTFPLLSTF